MNQEMMNRSGTALLVVDVQRSVMADAWQAIEVTGRIADLVDRARQADVPVVWVRHSSESMPVDSDGWQIVAALAPAAGELIIEKRYGDSFEDTNLEEVLAGLGVRRLVVCGAQSDACVLSTLFGGFVRGYDMTLVGDAHTTDDYSNYGAPTPDKVTAFINMVWTYRSAPGRTASVVTSEMVDW